jgi:hypothetical protein
MAVGLCRAAVAATAAHLAEAGFEHTGEKLRDLPVLRARVGRDELPHDAGARLQMRLGSLEAAIDVTDLAMKTWAAPRSRATSLSSVISATRAPAG